MKRKFGSFLTRSFLGPGINLTDVEHFLVDELIRSLPDWLKNIVEAQIEAYNVVQREVDGRALNFYSRGTGRYTNLSNKIPNLTMLVEEAPMMRITAQIGDDPDLVHATLNAVQGRVFCVAFSRRVDRYPPATTVRVIDSTDAWRSNFHRTKDQGEQIAATDRHQHNNLEPTTDQPRRR